MHEVKPSRFLPRWARADSGDRAIFGEMPEIGYVPDPQPSIPTRIVPKANAAGLSFHSLAEVAKTLQNVVNCVAHELLNGVDIAFDDMRQLGSNEDFVRFSRLYARPLESGSVIIPGELEDVTQEVNGRKYTTLDIVTRFIDIVEGVPVRGADFETSPAVLKSFEAFDAVLKRDVEYVEFEPPTLDLRPNKQPLVVDSSLVLDMRNARNAKSLISIKYGTLSGMFRAVDTTDRKLKIQLTGSDAIVPGSYPEVLQDRITLSLFKTAEFSGTVRYKGAVPQKIDITHIDFDPPNP